MKFKLKLFSVLLISLLITRCSKNDENTTSQDESITGVYCLDFALVGSQLTITKNQNSGNYAASINDFDGGINSGTATANYLNNILSLNGTYSVPNGQANFTAELTFDETTESFTGILNVLDPQGNIFIKSTINGEKGACNSSLSPANISTIVGQPYLTSLHTELNKIKKISKYRSAAGHNFVDYSGESCVNLKHYFHTYAEGVLTNNMYLPTSLNYFSPANGKIITMQQTRFSDDPTDYEIDIQLSDNQNVIVRIFHMTPKVGLSVGDTVTSGELIGSAPSAHLDSSDFAVYVLTNQGYRHISMFERREPSILQEYINKGVNSNWKQDLYYEVNDPYVSQIFCENGTWGNLKHPLSNWELNFFILN